MQLHRDLAVNLIHLLCQVDRCLDDFHHACSLSWGKHLEVMVSSLYLWFICSSSFLCALPKPSIEPSWMKIAFRWFSLLFTTLLPSWSRKGRQCTGKKVEFENINLGKKLIWDYSYAQLSPEQNFGNTHFQLEKMYINGQHKTMISLSLRMDQGSW